MTKGESGDKRAFDLGATAKERDAETPVPTLGRADERKSENKTREKEHEPPTWP